MKYLKNSSQSRPLAKFYVPVLLLIFSCFLLIGYMNCGVSDLDSLSLQSVRVPDGSAIVAEVARTHASDLRHACSDWTFLDALVLRLRNEANGWRFGYHCINRDCKTISRSEVAFYTKASRVHSVPPGATEVTVIKVLEGVEPCTANPRTTWKEQNVSGGWKFPRQSPDTGACQGASCFTTTTNPGTTSPDNNACVDGVYQKTALPCDNSENCVDGIHKQTQAPCGNTDPERPNNRHNYDEFDFSKIVWLHADVGNWEKTATISNMDFSKNDQDKYNGQICITHDKSGTWTPKEVSLSQQDAGFLGGESKGSFYGNAQVIIKVGEQYYGGTFAWLKKDEPCILKDLSRLADLYYSRTKSMGVRVNASPLDRVHLKGGDIIGFMVTGLARGADRNVSERSDIYWMLIPSVDGSIEDEHIPTPEDCSVEPDSLLCQGPNNCYVPNQLPVMNQLASWYNSDLQNTCIENDGSWNFMDKTATRLHSLDERFGYSCKQGNCENLAESEVAYFCDDGSPNSVSTNVKVFKAVQGHCSGNPQVAWGDVTESIKLAGFEARWKYPRNEDTVNTVSAGGCTKEDLPGHPDYHAIAAFGINEQHCTNSADYNILEVTASVRDVTRCCRIFDKNNCPAQLDYIHVNGNCYPSCSRAAQLAGYAGSGENFTLESGTSCGNLTSGGHSDWHENITFYDPYRFESVGLQANHEVLTRRNQGQNYVCCVRGEPTGTPAQAHNSQGLYTTSTTETSTSTTSTTGEGVSCEMAIRGVEGIVRRGDDCNNTSAYNIIKFVTNEESACCKTTPKSSTCPTGYTRKSGNCLPDCGTAARLAGYGNEMNHTLLPKGKYQNCKALSSMKENDGREVNGYKNKTNWDDVTFWDPYRFVIGSNDSSNISDVGSNDMCCVAGNSQNAAKPPCHAEGHEGGSHCSSTTTGGTTGSSSTSSSTSSTQQTNRGGGTRYDPGEEGAGEGTR